MQESPARAGLSFMRGRTYSPGGLSPLLRENAMAYKATKKLRRLRKLQRSYRLLVSQLPDAATSRNYESLRNELRMLQAKITTVIASYARCAHCSEESVRQEMRRWPVLGQSLA